MDIKRLEEIEHQNNPEEGCSLCSYYNMFDYYEKPECKRCVKRINFELNENSKTILELCAELRKAWIEHDAIAARLQNGEAFKVINDLYTQQKAENEALKKENEYLKRQEEVGWRRREWLDATEGCN